MQRIPEAESSKTGRVLCGSEALWVSLLLLLPCQADLELAVAEVGPKLMETFLSQPPKGLCHAQPLRSFQEEEYLYPNCVQGLLAPENKPQRPQEPEEVDTRRTPKDLLQLSGHCFPERRQQPPWILRKTS